jgi:hypothetical protein
MQVLATALLNLARSGDNAAFEELVARALSRPTVPYVDIQRGRSGLRRTESAYVEAWARAVAGSAASQKLEAALTNGAVEWTPTVARTLALEGSAAALRWLASRATGESPYEHRWMTEASGSAGPLVAAMFRLLLERATQRKEDKAAQSLALLHDTQGGTLSLEQAEELRELMAQNSTWLRELVVG